MAAASRRLGSLLIAVGAAVSLAGPASAEPVDIGQSAQSVIDGLKAEGYNVVINWLTGYDTVPLSVCTVSNINNPDDSVPPAGTFTTVYVDVSCPNHLYGYGLPSRTPARRIVAASRVRLVGPPRATTTATSPIARSTARRARRRRQAR